MARVDDLERLRVALKTVASEATAAADEVEAATVRIGSALDANRDRANRALGDLRSYLDQLQGPWAQELKLQLALLESGGQTLDDFISKFGNAMVTTETGTMRIRELLQGLDPKAFEAQVQDLARAAREGGEALAAGIELLRNKGGELTAQLVKAIEAYQRGSGSLDRILRLVEQLRTATGGASALDELTEAIVEGLRSGDLR
jgi:hypothetical protein